MNDGKTPGCPRVEALSALMDGALSASERDEIGAHAASCPLCGKTLQQFEAMSSRLQALRDTTCDVDLAALIDTRLAPRAGARAQRKWRERHGMGIWQLAPRGLAAAGMLVAGAYLGMMLVAAARRCGGGDGRVRRDAARTLCTGLHSCGPRRR